MATQYNMNNSVGLPFFSKGALPHTQYRVDGTTPLHYDTAARAYTDSGKLSLYGQGPCQAGGYGLDSSQLFPSQTPCTQGLSNVQIASTGDALWADYLFSSNDQVLTSTRGQSWDPRGDPATAAVVNADGSTGFGVYESTQGPYSFNKAVRTAGPI